MIRINYNNYLSFSRFLAEIYNKFGHIIYKNSTLMLFLDEKNEIFLEN